MKHFTTLCTLLLSLSAISQETTRPLTKRIIVKTNVLSLIAQRPTVTIEKVFTKTFSTEISFVQGEFNNFLFTDHYEYQGFLLRAKKYIINVDFGKISPYGAFYIGNLMRTILTTGQVDNSGYWGYPSRNFYANSIRGGFSLGIAYFSKRKINIDGLMSLGYGMYRKADRENFNGYLDLQVWLSVGYCF